MGSQYPPRRDPLLDLVTDEIRFTRRQDVLRQGEMPRVAHILLDGHTYRYKMLAGSRRQITAILVPGDLCDLAAVMRGRADYSVGALPPCTLGEIPLDRIVDQGQTNLGIQQSLLQHVMRDEAIAREWLINVGQRPALERAAHLFCETHTRKRRLGTASEDGYGACLTQIDLADALGLTPIHVNRVLKVLRTRGLIERDRGRMTLLDLPALEALAGFDPSYLQ